MKVAIPLLCLWLGGALGAEVGSFWELEKGVKCGSKYCKPTEYCTELSRSCEACDQICDEKHHNRDETTCKEECQCK